MNALAVGLAGALVTVGVFRLLRRYDETLAVVAATWISIAFSALLVALVLGVQPAIAHKPDGTPLFFPFGPEITVPALVLPHLLIGAGEAMLTLLVWRFASSRKWTPA